MSVLELRVVVEVLSPSTMSFDRIRKLPEYQTVASVSYILLVDTEQRASTSGVAIKMAAGGKPSMKG